MDELEIQVRALEHLFQMASMWAPRRLLEDLRDGLILSMTHDVDESERDIRRQALALVEDALEARLD